MQSRIVSTRLLGSCEQLKWSKGDNLDRDILLQLEFKSNKGREHPVDGAILINWLWWVRLPPLPPKIMNVDEIKLKLLENREIDSKGCWNWTRSAPLGYGQCNIPLGNGKYKNYKVHRLSAMVYKNYDLGAKTEICHKCDNKLCFNPEHLFEGSHKDNMDDAYSKNIISNGYGGQFNKEYPEGVKPLTEKVKSEIRTLYDSTDATQKELADKYGLSHQHVSRIVRGIY